MREWYIIAPPKIGKSQCTPTLAWTSQRRKQFPAVTAAPYDLGFWLIETSRINTGVSCVLCHSIVSCAHAVREQQPQLQAIGGRVAGGCEGMRRTWLT